MASKTIDNGYVMAEKIDLMKNTKLAIMINLGAVLVMLPFIAVPVLVWRLSDSFATTGLDISLSSILIFLLGIILIMVIHEFVHGLAFKYYSKAKIKYGFTGLYAYAGCPDWFFKKREYLVIDMAPCVVLNLLMVVSLFFVQGEVFYIIYLILAIHFSGCIGDIYVTLKLIRYPQIL